MENSKIQSEINSVKEQIKERGVFIQSLQDQIDIENIIQKQDVNKLKALEKVIAVKESSVEALKDISKNNLK